MEMNYGGAMVLPRNYVVMDQDEMTYVEGGGINLSMSSYYLNKKLCCDMGRGLLNTGQVTGMTYLQIAKEIYAHAVCYYIYENNSYLKHNLLAKYLHDKGADGIAIENGGDSTARQIFYSFVWKNC